MTVAKYRLRAECVAMTSQQECMSKAFLSAARWFASFGLIWVPGVVL